MLDGWTADEYENHMISPWSNLGTHPDRIDEWALSCRWSDMRIAKIYARLYHLIDGIARH